MTDIQNDLTGRACDASPAARSCQLQCKPRFLTGRTHEHANRGCSPMFACSRRILPSPAEAGFKPPHSRLERNEDNRGLRPRGTLYFLAAKSTDRSLRLVLFAAFWSAVNRGLRPRGTLYFLVSKVARKPRHRRGFLCTFDGNRRTQHEQRPLAGYAVPEGGKRA